jgi:hypothetical protein
MSTATIQDYRRTDQRTNALENPFWLTSAVVDGAAVSGLADKACVLFSFPKAGEKIIIWDVWLHIILGFTSGTTIDVGIYTLLTDAVTTAGDATLVGTINQLIPTATTVDATTIGWYGATASDWLTARAAGTHVANNNMITGVAAAVPCIAMTPKVATIIVGKAQLHLLVSIIPGT